MDHYEDELSEVELPDTRAVTLSEASIHRAGILAGALDRYRQESTDDDEQGNVVGVCLLRIDPMSGSVRRWIPDEDTGVAFTGIKYLKHLDGLLPSYIERYCAGAVRETNILDYITSKRRSLVGYRVIVHLHYYALRGTGDVGFHKDTRGQTLFFILHYLNQNPMYGAEFRVDQGEIVKYGKKTKRKSPSDEGELEMWPSSIRKDVSKRRRDREHDNKIHVLRIAPYGGCMVVDDVVSHQTPNLESRKEWGKHPRVNMKLSKFVQAREVNGAQGIWVQDYSDGERSMSDEDSSDDDVQGRRDETLNAPRRFFRIWITVSPDTELVRY